MESKSHSCGPLTGNPHKFKKIEIHTGLHTLKRTWIRKLKKLGHKVTVRGHKNLVNIQTMYHGVTLTFTLHTPVQLQSYCHLIPQSLIPEVSSLDISTVEKEDDNKNMITLIKNGINDDADTFTSNGNDQDIFSVLADLHLDDVAIVENEEDFATFSDEASDPYTEQFDEILDNMEMELCGLASSSSDLLCDTANLGHADSGKHSLSHNVPVVLLNGESIESKHLRLTDSRDDCKDNVDDVFTPGHVTQPVTTASSEVRTEETIPVLPLPGAGQAYNQNHDSLSRPHKLRIRQPQKVNTALLVYNLVQVCIHL